MHMELGDEASVTERNYRTIRSTEHGSFHIFPCAIPAGPLPPPDQLCRFVGQDA